MVDSPADLRRAMDAGARGYMLKGAAAAELPEAISRIMNGELYVQPALGAMLAAKVAMTTTHADPIAALSEREREVLDLLVLGHTNDRLAPLPVSEDGRDAPGEHPAQARSEEPGRSRANRLSGRRRALRSLPTRP